MNFNYFNFMSSLKIFIFNYLQVGLDVTLNCKSQPRKTNVKFSYVNAKIEKVWLLSPDIFEHKMTIEIID